MNKYSYANGLNWFLVWWDKMGFVFKMKQAFCKIPLTDLPWRIKEGSY